MTNATEWGVRYKTAYKPPLADAGTIDGLPWTSTGHRITRCDTRDEAEAIVDNHRRDGLIGNVEIVSREVTLFTATDWQVTS